LQVSEISLGLWTLGGPNWSDGQSVGWQDVDEKEDRLVFMTGQVVANARQPVEV